MVERGSRCKLCGKVHPLGACRGRADDAAGSLGDGSDPAGLPEAEAIQEPVSDVERDPDVASAGARQFPDYRDGLPLPGVGSAAGGARRNGTAGDDRRSCGKLIDVAALRHRLSMTQVMFAREFGLNLRTVMAWEQGGARGSLAELYLRVIDKQPDAVRAAVRRWA